MIGQGDLLLNNLSPICSFCFNFMGGAQKINKELIWNVRNIFVGSHAGASTFLFWQSEDNSCISGSHSFFR
jgi:hypothetical protein